MDFFSLNIKAIQKQKMKISYKFEMLDAGSLHYDYEGTKRCVAEDVTEEESWWFAADLESQLREEFDQHIDVSIDMKQQILHLDLSDECAYHDCWEGFAFRRKGIPVNYEFYIRLVKII
jgi:hypothetical protein